LAKFAIFAVLVAAAPVIAGTTVLDFAGNAACADGAPVIASYGDTPDVDVSYLTRQGAGNTSVVSPFMVWWDSGFSDLQGVITGNQVSEIRLELLSSGKNITLNSFDTGRFAGAFLTDLRVYDLGWNLLWTVTDQFAPVSGARLCYAPAVMSASGLIIQHGPGSENRGLDNIVFTVTNVAGGAAVPEPSGWIMLIAGFGITGAALRRRSLRLVQAVA
jgi:hypothetical protein